LSNHKGKDTTEVVPQNSIYIGVVVEKIQTFFIDQPGDMTFGVFSLHSWKESCGSQYISLSPALDDENRFRECLVVLAAVTEPFERARLIALEIKTVGLEQWHFPPD
jgi:hypothetical protein